MVPVAADGGRRRRPRSDNDEQADRFVTQRQAAELCGCSKDTIIRARLAGRLPKRPTRRSDRPLSEFDVDGEELEWMGGSTVRFSVYEVETSDEDDDSLNTSVPFQVAYAVSIHKAQGLEYDSVKIVITDANEDDITHNIFYTAITRGRVSGYGSSGRPRPSRPYSKVAAGARTRRTSLSCPTVGALLRSPGNEELLDPWACPVGDSHVHSSSNRVSARNRSPIVKR